MKTKGMLISSFAMSVAVAAVGSSLPAHAEVLHCEGVAPYSEPLKMAIDYDSTSGNMGRIQFSYSDGSPYVAQGVGPFQRTKQDGFYIYTEAAFDDGTAENPSAKTLMIRSNQLAGKDLKAMFSMPLSGFSSIAMSCSIQGQAVPPEPVCPTGKLDNLLLQASRVGTPAEVKALLECGANINAVDEKGCTPLLIVSDLGCGFRSQVSDDPLDPNSSSRPTGSRSSFDIDKFVTIMTRAGADIQVQDPVDHQTALHKAAKYSNSNAADLLAELGADVNAQDSDGNTPLMLASATGDVLNVKTILHYSPNRSLKNKSGQTAYDIAKEFDARELLDLLRPVAKSVVIQGGANGGCTPTMIHLEQGVEVEISLQAAGPKMFKIDAPDLGIDLMAMPGEPAKQTITPSKQGTFPFTCGVHGAPDSQQTHGKVMVM